MTPDENTPMPERPEGRAVNCGICGDLGTVFPTGDPCNCRAGRMLAEGITEEDLFIPYSERP